MVAQKLTPLQLELLKVYSFTNSNKELLDIKRLLANYFSKKMIAKVDKAVENNNIDEKVLDNWLNSDE